MNSAVNSLKSLHQKARFAAGAMWKLLFGQAGYPSATQKTLTHRNLGLPHPSKCGKISCTLPRWKTDPEGRVHLQREAVTNKEK